MAMAVLLSGKVQWVALLEPNLTKDFYRVLLWELDSSINRGQYWQLLRCFGISEANQPKVGAKLGLGQAGVVPEGLLLLQLSTIMINSSPT